MAQIKEQIKTLEKELSEMEIDDLSDAEFKTLVIKMLKKFIEYSEHTREKMKAALSEIKNHPQGASSETKEARVQINDLEHKEEIKMQPELNKEKKNLESIKRLWNISKSANLVFLQGCQKF